ncbi:MAG: phenylalanine 4-monooxygenase [Gemmatimonadales bacterium]
MLDPASESAFLITQHWSAYTPEDHEVWATLYARRMASLRVTGSAVFLRGADAIGLRPDRVPHLEDVNRRLATRTGWSAVPVSGFLPARAFFACLAQRRFPTTVIIRPKERLDYLPEPDIFHDVFGHVPMHADPVFARFLQAFGGAAMAAQTNQQVEAMARLFWFTVEFGLIREGGEVKVYGSGLISSSGDAANALGPSCERRPFRLEVVLAQPYEIDHLQAVLFVIDTYDQLFAALESARALVGLGAPTG